MSLSTFGGAGLPVRAWLAELLLGESLDDGPGTGGIDGLLQAAMARLGA